MAAPWLAYAIALAVTLVLASLLTPKSWWRRPNLRALAVLLAGTWGIGATLLALAPAPAPERAQAQAQANTAPLTLTGTPLPFISAHVSYRVFEDLNLRAAAGVGARRLALVPAGSSVTTTGAREGDWWQVRAKVSNDAAAPDVEGWVSSLWLRRAEEVASRRSRRQAAGAAGAAG